MTTDSYAEITEKNITESDGTLIMSHGTLTGDSKHTQYKAKEHNKPYLHIDLDKLSVFKAANVVKLWTNLHR